MKMEDIGAMKASDLAVSPEVAAELGVDGAPPAVVTPVPPIVSRSDAAAR